jgi:hypothetical protein
MTKSGDAKIPDASIKLKKTGHLGQKNAKCLQTQNCIDLYL